ncbi:MAG: hypothetical protein U0X20_20440 [Caldilineaceae bacterium]
MNIKTLIQASLINAADLPDEGSQPGTIHHNRSKQLVEAIAAGFRREYTDQPAVRVMSKHSSLNQSEFGLNELLFDVLVCEIGKTPSARKVAELTYIIRALWAVESEMARDTRQALFDFNKLVLASSANKLFVGPKVADPDAYLNVLLFPARCCSSSVFVALVPHPGLWGNCELSVDLWQLIDDTWRRI